MKTGQPRLIPANGAVTARSSVKTSHLRCSLAALVAIICTTFPLFCFLAGEAAAEPVPHAITSTDLVFRDQNGSSPVAPSFLGDPPFPEGSAWNGSGSIILKGPSDELTITFREPVSLSGIALQADNNDSYFVDSESAPGVWTTLWVAPKVPNRQGLRTRAAKIAATITRLRIRAGSGDGNFSVSRLLLFPPSTGDEAFQFAPYDWTTFLFDSTPVAKRCVALVGLVAALLALYSGSAALRRRSFKAAGALALISLPLWWNLGTAHYGVYLHHWDFGHYYLGAKYFDEVGYFGLYRCALQADYEAGALRPEDNPIIRDLTTNSLRHAQELQVPPSECHSNFTDARWRAFTADIAWFRERMSADRWAGWKKDHGFNGTPVWTILGGLLANSIPLSEQNAFYLQAIDWWMMIAMWGILVWGFGWRGAAFAALYWSTNALAPYLWTGSSFLRHDWLLWFAASAAFLKRGHPATGGALLAYAALLRIFPALVVIPWCLVKVRVLLSTRRLSLSTEEKRFIAGGLAAAVILCGVASIRTSYGLSAFADFKTNIEKHQNTPLTNCTGLPFLLSFSADRTAYQADDPRAEDPFVYWKAKQQETFASRRWIYFLLLALYAAPFLLRRTSFALWESICLGVTAVPLLTSLTFYYYGFLLLLGFLFERARCAVIALIGIALLSQEVEGFFPAYDVQGAATSLIILLGIYTIVYAATAGSERSETRLEEA